MNKPNKRNKERMMITFHNCCSKEMELSGKREKEKSEVEIRAGSETLPQIDGLKRMARVMRFMTKKKRAFFAEQMRPMIEQGVPSDLPQEDHDKMVNDLLAMYSDPKAIMAYANDAVFKDEFWNNISYQTERVTAAFKDGTIDVDTFMDTPMQEQTKFKDDNLRAAAASNLQVKLKGKKYYVSEGKGILARRPLHALHRSLCHLARHPHGHAHLEGCSRD